MVTNLFARSEVSLAAFLQIHTDLILLAEKYGLEIVSRFRLNFHSDPIYQMYHAEFELQGCWLHVEIIFDINTVTVSPKLVPPSGDGSSRSVYLSDPGAIERIIQLVKDYIENCDLYHKDHSS